LQLHHLQQNSIKCNRQERGDGHVGQSHR
jgi:hypothetical protein